MSLGARGPSICRPGRRVGVRDNQDGRRVDQAGDLPPDGGPPSHVRLHAYADLGGMGCQHMMPTPRGEDLHEEGVGILRAPEEGSPGGCPGADVYFQARPRLALGGEHDVTGVVLEGGSSGPARDWASARMRRVGRRAAMCRACARRRCRRYRPRTLSHRYPAACTSSGVPSILGLRGSGVLRLRVRL